MRKIMVALPCLLFCGLVSAKQVTALDSLHGAEGVLMTTALDASHPAEQPLVRASGVMEAANRKSLKAAGAKSASATPASSSPAPVRVGETSKRFNMTQDGKRMTADDFDAWMKKNGYRVATGAPAAAKDAEPKKGSK